MDLGEQIVGDVNGPGLALYFEGQVMAGMAGTGLAVAAWATALSAEGNEAGGDKRAVKLERLDAGRQEAADQGGVPGYFHGARIADYGAGITETYKYAPE